LLENAGYNRVLKPLYHGPGDCFRVAHRPGAIGQPAGTTTSSLCGLWDRQSLEC
jgi:hypothetical protein